MSNVPMVEPLHDRPSGLMRNIGRNAAVTARKREQKFRDSMFGLPNYLNRGSKGLNISTGNTYERSANGQNFKYRYGNLKEGKEWLGSESTDPDRNMSWQGTFGPNGYYRVKKGGKKRNKKTRKNKRY